MHVHLVFVAKYRKKVFNTEILRSMEESFKNICSKFEAELKEFNGERDHVHLVINYPPKYSVSVLVNSLKGISSRLLRAEFERLRGKYWQGVLCLLVILQVVAVELLLRYLKLIFKTNKIRLALNISLINDEVLRAALIGQ